MSKMARRIGTLGLVIGIWGVIETGLEVRVQAQSFDLGAVELQQGTVLSVTPAGAAAPQYFNSDSVAPFNVVLDRSIYDDQGRLLLPAGSKIYGQLQPAPGGVEFIGKSLVVENRAYSIVARSAILPDEKDPRQYSEEAITEDAAIGAVTGTALGLVTGGLGWTSVLGGVASGVVAGNVTAHRAVVLRPGQAFDLVLDAPIRI